MKCRTTVDDLFKAPDDRKIVITVGELKRNFEREYNARTDKIFEEIKRDIVAQLMATAMVELNKEFGFGTGSLRRFKNGTEGLFISMAKEGIMFVETKRPNGGQASKLQRWLADRLHALGFEHYWVHTKEDIYALRERIEEVIP